MLEKSHFQHDDNNNNNNNEDVFVRKRDKNEKCVYVSQVPHIRQQFSWDCGPTCIRMAVKYCLNDMETENLDTILDKHDRKQGLWSIDLAFILHELGVRTSFYTKMLGADENYASTTYYASSFSKDENRVNQLFQLAEQNGMTVYRKHCENCFSITVKQLLNNFYQGHYIVLVGYDLQTQSILYRDPGSRDTLCSTSLRSLEFARKCSGTDEDVLFLFSDFVRY